VSGGHFDYGQDCIREIADDIQDVINENNDTTPDQFGYPRGRQYSPEVIAKLNEAVKHLHIAYVYAQRVDWLLSDDDGEESFLRRLEEELKEVQS
jgi:hypothetical protein